MIRFSKFYRENKNIVDARYRIFKSKVNMTYKEMVEWKKNSCSRAASIKIDEVINRVTRLLKKPKTTWTEKDFKDSAKVISYISRATKIKDSLKPAAPKIGCTKGKNFYALRNWAYDRNKEKRRKRINPYDEEFINKLRIQIYPHDKNKDVMYFAAFMADVPVGYIVYIISENVIDFIQVEPSFQKKGVATYLLTEVYKKYGKIPRPSDVKLEDGKALTRTLKIRAKELKKSGKL